MPNLQGFRFAPPPACNLAPLRGLCSSEYSFEDYAVVNSLSVITAMSDNVGISQMPGSMLSHSENRKEEGRGWLLRLSIISLLRGMTKTMGTVYDLTYSALKVHQNTGRGEA